MPCRLRCVVLACLALPGLAHAADFTVTRFDDPVPDTCTPADCSLREAVLASNAGAGSDRILLGAGTYALTVTENQVPAGSPSGSWGPLFFSDTVEVVGAGRTSTSIAPAPTVPVVFALGLDDASGGLTLSDLSVVDYVPFDSFFGVLISGAGNPVVLQRFGVRDTTLAVPTILATGPLTIVDSVFEDNTSSGGSGSIIAASGSPHITRSEFIGNTTSGGVILLGPVISLPIDDVVLRNNRFVDNISGSGSGSAAITVLADGGSASVDLSDSVFEGNHGAGDGGAVSLGYISNAPNTTRLAVIAHGVRFEDNIADGDCGALLLDAPAALGLLEPPTLDVDLARFAGNSSAGAGGALCNRGATTIARTTFATNIAATRGGAILHEGDVLEVKQSTLSGNDAGSSGGAIFAATPLTIQRSTFDSNDAVTSGGALYLSGGGESLMRHVTLTTNRANGIANGVRVLYGSGETVLRFDNSILQACSASHPDALTDSMHNIESPGDTCGLGPLNNSRNITPSQLALGVFTDNGGPTLTRLPQAGSVALNRIIVVPSCIIEDQRGYVGTGGNCDIGAVEAGAVPVEPLPPEIFDDGFE